MEYSSGSSTCENGVEAAADLSLECVLFPNVMPEHVLHRSTNIGRAHAMVTSCLLPIS